jgi:hypothetical protein
VPTPTNETKTKEKVEKMDSNEFKGHNAPTENRPTNTPIEFAPEVNVRIPTIVKDD